MRDSNSLYLEQNSMQDIRQSVNEITFYWNSAETLGVLQALDKYIKKIVKNWLEHDKIIGSGM